MCVYMYYRLSKSLVILFDMYTRKRRNWRTQRHYNVDPKIRDIEVTFVIILK